MKHKLTITLFTALLFGTAQAQLPFTYTLDTTSFGALMLEGGMTQVRLVDINSNGHLDIVTIGDHGSPNVNTNQHGVSVFFGNGTGANWTLSQNGTFGYGGCAVGDLNNDGKQDIAYSLHHDYSTNDLGDQLIEAAIGDGTGMNWTPWDDGLATNGESWGMFGTDIGDIDNDGWLDIASNSFGSGKGIHIYKNNKNGTWTQAYTFGNGNTFHYIQFGDMDGDGNLDFVASNYQGSTFFGDGNGNFTLKKNGLLPLPNSNGFPYQDVSLADIDNDGDDDLIFSDKYSNSGVCGVYVYKWNKATQSWVNHSTGLPSFSSSDKIMSARAADIDMDGFADIVCTSDLLNEVQIYKGNGGASWTKIYSLALPNFTGAEDIAIADIDHSGYPDVLVWGSFLGGGMFTPKNENKILMFRDMVTPHSLNATLSYPKGNECWHNNAVKFINWVSAVPSNHSSSVKIEYSTAGTSGPWTLIVAAAPNNGAYQWTVPASVNSSNCFIRITVNDNVTSGSATSVNTLPFSIGCTNSTTGISEINEVNSVSVYPNPSAGSFTFTAANLTELLDAEINIVDMLGQYVPFTRVGVDKISVSADHRINGIYFLQIKNADAIQTVKFVLEN